MARPKKKTKEDTLLEEVKQNKKDLMEVPIEEMPLNTIGDYVRYNERCRALNKRLGLCRYKVKQCPLELHPKQRVIFNRRDQPKNPLPVYLEDEMIYYKEKLIPGRTYDLPLNVIDHLASKGNPIWDWVEKPNGEKETKKVATDPRFALRTVYSETA